MMSTYIISCRKAKTTAWSAKNMQERKDSKIPMALLMI